MSKPWFALILVTALSTRPAVADEVARADVARWLAFFDKLVDTVVADQGKCPKMAADVQALIDANAELLRKAAQADRDHRKLPKDAQDHVDAGVRRMMGGLQSCASDPAVQAAMGRLGVAPAK
jgi:hypothetical protein